MGPDQVRHAAPYTFESRQDAEGWLTDERRLLAVLGTWTAPKDRARAQHRAKADALSFGTYADAWLNDRDLKPRTRESYRSLLDTHLFPTFADVPLAEITPESVRSWYSRFGTSWPTLRAMPTG